ncbi:MAG: hypothetical protein AUJ12_02340 [Alphaproteobacteria bacterium CG1_02_46_17]|nr:MAG: hypothetical protein AUJ12_02340 [Alphaproteobacteria bacterium CG1_02_46_17]
MTRDRFTYTYHPETPELGKTWLEHATKLARENSIAFQISQTPENPQGKVTVAFGKNEDLRRFKSLVFKI